MQRRAGVRRGALNLTMPTGLNVNAPLRAS